MKQLRFGTLIALVLLLCLGLHTAVQALGPPTAAYYYGPPTTTSYVVGVTTPGGPSDPPAGPAFLYYNSTGTLNVVGQSGELTASNLRYKWTAKMKKWQSGSYGTCNAPTDFLDAGSPPNPPKDTSTANPTTTLRTVLSNSGYYQLTLSVTITYDMVDSSGNGQHDITASGTANCQIAVSAPDFSMSSGTSLSIPLDSSAPVTVTATPINGFTGIVSLSLTPTATSNSGSPVAANPDGVTLGSGSGDTSLSIDLPGFGPTNTAVSTTTTVNVAATATPGNYPLTIYGDGSDNGPTIEHSTSDNYAGFNLTIPKRYVEIDGPFDNNTHSKQGGLNKRMPDGSITVDTVIDVSNAPPSTGDGGTPNGGPYWFSDPFSVHTQGFSPAMTYIWHGNGTMQAFTLPGGLGTPGQQGAIPVETGTTIGNGTLYFTSSTGPSITSPISTTISVDARNTSGSKITTNTYTIRFHEQYENVVNTSVHLGSGLAPPLPSVLSSRYATCPDKNPGPNSVFQVYYDPSQIEFDENGTAKFMGLLATAGGAAATVEPIVSAIPSWIGPVLTVFGYALGTYAPDPPAGSTSPQQANYVQFLNSLYEQISIDSNKTTYVIQPQLARWTSTTGLSRDQAENVYQNSASIQHDPNGSTNSWFQQINGPVSAKCVGARQYNTVPWKGDLYDANGYNGPTSGNFKFPGNPVWVFQWSLGTVNPNPAPASNSPSS